MSTGWVQFVGGLLLALVVNEFTAVGPWLSARTLRLAVRCLPERHKERVAEEWGEALDQTPGSLFKLLNALMMLGAAALYEGGRGRELLVDGASRAAGAATLVFLSPLLVLIWLAVMLVYRQPPLIRVAIFLSEGAPPAYYGYRFRVLLRVRQSRLQRSFGLGMVRLGFELLPACFDIAVGRLNLFRDLGRRRFELPVDNEDHLFSYNGARKVMVYFRNKHPEP